MRNPRIINVGVGQHVARIRKTLLTGSILVATILAGRAEFTVKTEPKAPPTVIGESIRNSLRSEAITLFDGDKPVYEFWFRKEIPLKSVPEASEKSLNSIRETTLMGVAVVHGEPHDYKDNGVIDGTNTVRFSLQPTDGDHLGTAEFPYFFALIPAKYDTELDGITRYKQMVKASGKDTTTGHPMVLSLRPVSGKDPNTPKLTEPAADHKSIRIQLTGKGRNSDKTVPLLFDLVFSGKGHF